MKYSRCQRRALWGARIQWFSSGKTSRRAGTPRGEVETKNDYSYETYKWSNGASSGANGYTKYNSSETWGPVVDNKHFLEPEDDIATVTLGSPWRMPTRAEMEELSNYCNWEWKEVNGHPGYEITSRLTGNSIFLPAVSSRSHTNTEIITEPVIYFSNQKDDSFTRYGFRLDKNSRSTTTLFREYGTNIRAVRE